MRFEYAVNLVWSPEDEAYVATVPELPGLSAFGDTAEEAAGEVARAAEAFVEVLAESGCPIPAPLKMTSFSGQFRVRVPVSMHETLVARARREGVSLNTLIVSLLAEGLGSRGDRFLQGVARPGLDREAPGVTR